MSRERNVTGVSVLELKGAKLKAEVCQVAVGMCQVVRLVGLSAFCLVSGHFMAAGDVEEWDSVSGGDMKELLTWFWVSSHSVRTFERGNFWNLDCI